MFIRAVRQTSDLQRIKSLPRRTLTLEWAKKQAARFTRELAKVPGVELKPWQGAALAEAKRTGTGACLWFPVGIGKAQPNDEPVLTPSGWRTIGSLVPGDSVIGSEGTAVLVTGVYPQGLRKVARVFFTDGSYARSDYDHLWTFRNAASDGLVQTRTLREWLEFGLHRPCGEHTARKLFALQCQPVQLPEQELPIDPYTLGALLGDGGMTQGTINFTSMDPDIVEALCLPGAVRLVPTACQNSGRATQYNLTQPRGMGANPLTEALRDLGLQGHGSHTKFVPAVYWGGSIGQRTALLQGLLDTDGGCAAPGGTIEYSTASDALADAVCWLVESLGGSCRRGARSTSNGNHRLGLKLPRSVSPFRCTRKRQPYEAQTPQRGAYRAVERVEPAGTAECTCISVDAPDHLYVTRHCLLTHNTLVAETMPVVLEAQSSVLILNASLVDKTYKDRRELRGAWKTANPPARIITRESLALEANAYLLDQIDPDLVIIDESDEFSNFDASATQRIHRFWLKRAKAGNPCKVVSMTGTPSRRSIMAVWHHLVWCLGDMAPVPLARADAEQWAAALDDAAPRQGFRPAPGALGATLEDARTWYLDRLRSTPGVVIVDEDSAGDIPLHVGVELAPHCPDIEAAFDELRMFWRSPSGEPVSDPLSLARIAGQIGCGLVSYYEPPPPQRWREARSGAAKFIRERISQTRHAQRPLDTDAQVMRAHPEHPAVVEWKKEKPTYDPLKHTRVRWISDATLQWAARWLTSTDEPSILWCGSVEFAAKLSQLVRLPYFGPKGREVRSGRGLHDADPTRSMVCSWHANKRGFNLQAWRRNGVIMPPQSAKYLEQMFGRAHRQGQTEAVHWTILATSGDTLDSFAAAIGEAAFVAETTGLHQKLLRAEIEELPMPPKTLRWATRD